MSSDHIVDHRGEDSWQSAETATILAFPRLPSEEYVARKSLPFELMIDDWRVLSEVRVPEVGRVKTTLVHFEDSSQVVLRKTIPDKPQSGISADFVPPLGTHVNGLNTYIARLLARRKLRSRIVGTNQAHGFSLLHDAQMTLEVLRSDDADGLGGQTCDADRSVLFGYSMGEMKNLGMLGLAPLFSREVVAAIGVDAAFAEKINYRDLLAHIPQVAGYVVREALEIPPMVKQEFNRSRSAMDAFRQLKLIGSTISPSPRYLSNLGDKWKVITTGETGTFLQHIPPETVMVLHFFDKSRFNDRAQYQARLSHLEFARFITEDGRHITGARPEVLEVVANKVALAARLADEGVSKSDLAEALNTTLLKTA